MPAHRKRISPKEREFAHLIASGVSPQKAARKAFGWKCETYDPETTKAYNLAKTTRIRKEIDSVEKFQRKEAEAESLIISGDRIDWDNLRKFCFKRLEEIRDNDQAAPQSRINAINALEKLLDPSTDVNLIWKYIDIIWRGAKIHCPRCHNSFPSWKVVLPKLDEYRILSEKSFEHPEEEDDLTRRMELIKQAERRKKPHRGQVIALEAPERHLVGMAAARAGKSWLLALMAYMAYLIPGVEIWVLARIYEDARSEVEFIRGFLKNIFFPFDKHMIKERIDAKTGEMILTSKWGSELRIKSAKAQGSITGRELEMCLVAEPAWVPDELYEEVRARMSSRLGRILAFGTPKGYGGFLARMKNMKGRDPKTGKIVRIKDEDRLIKNGSPWGQSMLVYNLRPEDNPEYVISELDAARLELTDAEYDAEFRGIMTAEEGAKFPHIKEYMKRKITRDEYEKCSFIQGIDQGEKNFGAVLLGYDGTTIYVAREYLDDSESTIKANLLKLRKTGPMLVRHMGGHEKSLNLTIFDEAPMISNILSEMEREATPWPTEYTYRHKNKQAFGDNWRDETAIWINQKAKNGLIVFDEECDQLLWQILDCLNKPSVPGREGKSASDKGWVVNDKWRGDHVLDAFMLAMWTIVSGQVKMAEKVYEIKKGWADHEAAFKYRLARDEHQDLSGYSDKKDGVDAIFEDAFGRPRRGGTFLPNVGYYKDY